MSSIAQRILERKRKAAEEAATSVATTTTHKEKEKEDAKSESEVLSTSNTPVPQTSERQEEQSSKPLVVSKPARLSDLLGDYQSIESLRNSPTWRLLSLAERIQVGRLFEQQRKLAASADSNANSGSHSSVTTPLATEKKPLSQAVVEVFKEGEHIPASSPSVVDKQETWIERLFRLYPSAKDLYESEDFAKMSMQEKADATREYVKRAQIEAQIIHKHQREIEAAITKENQRALMASGASTEVNAVSQKHEAFSLSVVLNEKQQLAVEYALAGKCFVLTGAAGTGKTTACREIAKAFLARGGLGYHTFKTESGERVTSHGIAFCSYTRRATANIRRALHKDPELEKELEENIVTIHRLLEYEPEFYTEMVNGELKNKMRFLPKRDATRPLDIKVLVIEEGSMLGLDLWEKLYAAMRAGTIIVFVGDINQLPPVFGKSVMNYALAQLPVVELTEVYRQALDSGVIVNAHRILKGEAPENNKDTQIVTGNSPTHVGQEKMSRALGNMFFQLWQKDKEYDPEQDIILSPWNKQPCGTSNLNAWISQFLGEQRKAMVYEVLAGRQKLYLAVGDRVMYEKRDGIITAIRHNAQYLGKAPQPASTSLTRFGLRKLDDNGHGEDFELAATPGYENLNIDEIPDEQKKLQASHTVTLRLDDGAEEVLSAVGDFAEQVFSLGYCLTVHKAQGCEWRKVFVVLHKDHTLGGFLTRELVYTASTRAREKLIFIAKPDTLKKAVKQQEIKGNTLEEKIQSINSGAANIGTYPVVKRVA